MNPSPAPSLVELLDRKREGRAWSDRDLRQLAAGLADGSMSDAQAGALAMAVCLQGMTPAETSAWTLAMRDSGERWQWSDLGGPTVDKHSTGGVGDTVSLILGPLLAACGAFVPMVSGRGLGHTGGTLDKLEAIRGYQVQPGAAQLRQVLRDAGVAIVGASEELAPADRRLYAVRDVTGTVASLPLIVSSILAKKLAAGLDALVMDVKVGSGAFMPGASEARALARGLVSVGADAGLPTRAWLTPMDQALAPAAGNALETKLAIDVLTGRVQHPRLMQVTMTLCADALQAVGIAVSADDAHRRLTQALASGAAAERFARMVSGLGGPSDVLERNDRGMDSAPVQRAVIAAPDADSLLAGGQRMVVQVDVRRLGWAVVALGAGRRRETDRIDPRVGLTHLAALGDVVEPGAPLALVHAATEDAADLAAAAVRAAYRLSVPDGAAPVALGIERVMPGAGTA